MRAADLQLNELVDFEEGRIALHGRRLVLHAVHAFAHLRGDLVRMVGPEQTRRLLTRFGYYWGHADAAAMKRIFTWSSMEELLLAGPRFHALQGAMRTDVRHLSWEAATGRFEMELVWRGSAEAEQHVAELGASEAPACWTVAAYMSGYASFCLKRPVVFIETQCRAQAAHRVCRATGRDRESWGEEVLLPHLPYFEEEDIIGKIQVLTEELKRQQQEMERERQRAEGLRSATRPIGEAFVESQSPAYQRVLDIAERVAPYDSSVLITGESGTGKEVLARHIHRLSRRAGRPFLAVNCGALPETLLESELFGHRAGAFTGAVQDRKGLFEQASGGSLLLDEVGEMPPSMQVKLLRALQEREIVRVGESQPRPVDIRVLAATNRHLPAEIRRGRFRDDLYYRLSVVEIEVPPLRERQQDLVPLARSLVERLAGTHGIKRARIDPRCYDYMTQYPWPGNIRELSNTLERALLMSRDGVVRPEHLPRPMLEPESAPAAPDRRPRSLAEVEREHIEAVLRHTNGNRTEAARILGIGATTLWRKMKAEAEP
jgi:transcriptional regulator with PAS, ATPase and Fis domain